MASEKRLIDVSVFLEMLDCVDSDGNYAYYGYSAGEIGEALCKTPTVDAVEVVHGYNIDQDYPSLFECSICHWSCNDTYYGDTAEYNYCPNCGAKMDGDGNG